MRETWKWGLPGKQVVKTVGRWVVVWRGREASRSWAAARGPDVASHMAPISGSRSLAREGVDLGWLFWPGKQQRTSFYTLLGAVSSQPWPALPGFVCYSGSTERERRSWALDCFVQTSVLETCFTKDAMITVCSLLTRGPGTLIQVRSKASDIWIQDLFQGSEACHPSPGDHQGNLR